MGEPQCSTDLTMTEVRPPKFLTGIERFYACARHRRNAGARAGGARCQPRRQTAYGLSRDLAGHPKSILRYHPPLFENTPTGRKLIFRNASFKCKITQIALQSVFKCLFSYYKGGNSFQRWKFRALRRAKRKKARGLSILVLGHAI